ncbi:hypothetical protein [Shimia sagamensis]|uniref:Uncharacterized protein n=1 Tax=Shimia sagamensis TaxID=1566352 RepID=A0ABY1PH18_9RHOB|nr:hypothetical protein [Shimia sagamensis]SMP33521.1 hypothetical protein SAMN06265373_10980 [Shimia sagamensis]
MTFFPYVCFDCTSEEAKDVCSAVFDANDIVKMCFTDAPPKVGMQHMLSKD